LLYVYDMKVSPDGKIVALVGDSQILMWNTATYKQIIFPTIKAIIKNLHSKIFILKLGFK